MPHPTIRSHGVFPEIGGRALLEAGMKKPALCRAGYRAVPAIRLGRLLRSVNPHVGATAQTLQPAVFRFTGDLVTQDAFNLFAHVG